MARRVSTPTITRWPKYMTHMRSPVRLSSLFAFYRCCLLFWHHSSSSSSPLILTLHSNYDLNTRAVSSISSISRREWADSGYRGGDGHREKDAVRRRTKFANVGTIQARIVRWASSTSTTTTTPHFLWGMRNHTPYHHCLPSTNVHTRTILSSIHPH